MENNNIVKYLQKTNTISLSVLFGVFTYEMLETMKKSVLDPVFESIFPEESFTLNIILFKDKKIKLGKVIYEIFRWLVYVVLCFLFYEIHKRGIGRTLDVNKMNIIALLIILIVTKNIVVKQDGN